MEKDKQERIDLYWDKEKLNELVTSNVPKYFVEHYVLSTLLLEDESLFLKKSKELGLLKRSLY